MDLMSELYFLWFLCFLINLFSFVKSMINEDISNEVPICVQRSLVEPEEYTLPELNVLWTPDSYSAFDLSKNVTLIDPREKHKRPEKSEEPIPAVNEKPINFTQSDPKNKRINSKMASNEEIIGAQRRDSFDYRVWDDLCEDILQWLPLDEKIKLRVVSKQLNRCLKTLCLRQKVLKIVSHAENDRNNCREFVRQMSRNIRKKVFRFTNLLQTFPNITSIDFWEYEENETYIYQIFDAITENCNKLECFKSATVKISFNSQSVSDFARKFGSTLKSLAINSDTEDNFDFKTLINRFTSLKSLTVAQNFDELDDTYIEVKGLKRLCIDFSSSGVLVHDLPKIVENNKGLTHLVIGFYYINPREICVAFKMISQLKELRYLNIQLMDGSNDPKMAKSFELITKNCIHLKSFDFEHSLEHVFTDFFLIKGFFNAFKGFSSLNKFNYRTNSPNEYNLSIDCIENCKQLTDLSLKSANIPKEFFSAIDTVFPLLKNLFIQIEDHLTDNQMTSISRLKQLAKLTISSMNNSNEITNSGILSLINGCNRLKSLIFSFKPIPQTTDPSIPSILQKAIENPGVYFQNSLGSKKYFVVERNDYFNTIEIEIY